MSKKELLIRRNKANIYRIGKNVFYPGITKFTDPDVIREIQAHPSYQALLDNKVHEVVESISQVKPKELTSNISEMNAKDAKAIIEDTYAIPILEEMMESENDGKSRKSILEAIRDQMEDIRRPPEKEGEEE